MYISYLLERISSAHLPLTFRVRPQTCTTLSNNPCNCHISMRSNGFFMRRVRVRACTSPCILFFSPAWRIAHLIYPVFVYRPLIGDTPNLRRNAPSRFVSSISRCAGTSPFCQRAHVARVDSTLSVWNGYFVQNQNFTAFSCTSL